MKKIIYSYFAFLFLVLQSCSTDNTNDSISNADLIGKWKIEKSSEQDLEECDYLGWTEFKNDGTYIEYDACDSSTAGGSWSRKDKDLTVIDSDFPIPITFKILSLSENTMVLKYSIYEVTLNKIN